MNTGMGLNVFVSKDIIWINKTNVKENQANAGTVKSKRANPVTMEIKKMMMDAQETARLRMIGTVMRELLLCATKVGII